MTPLIAPLQFVRSDRFTQVHKAPKLVYHKIGPAPAVPPFQVMFVPVNLKFDQKPTNHEGYMEFKHSVRTLERILIHLCDTFWVHTDGKINKDEPDPLFKKDLGLPVFLCMDFSSWHTEAAALYLPPERGEVKEVGSQFPLDPWRICLKKHDDPTWHDHIMFEGGSFILQSVYEEHQKQISS